MNTFIVATRRTSDENQKSDRWILLYLNRLYLAFQTELKNANASIE